jgi:hypothetical protein
MAMRFNSLFNQTRLQWMKTKLGLLDHFVAVIRRFFLLKSKGILSLFRDATHAYHSSQLSNSLHTIQSGCKVFKDQSKASCKSSADSAECSRCPCAEEVKSCRQLTAVLQGNIASARRIVQTRWPITQTTALRMSMQSMEHSLPWVVERVVEQHQQSVVERAVVLVVTQTTTLVGLQFK